MTLMRQGQYCIMVLMQYKELKIITRITVRIKIEKTKFSKGQVMKEQTSNTSKDRMGIIRMI